MIRQLTLQNIRKFLKRSTAQWLELVFASVSEQNSEHKITSVPVSKTSQKQDKEEFGSLNDSLLYPAYLTCVLISSSTYMPNTG